jgi:hypothetical protein
MPARTALTSDERGVMKHEDNRALRAKKNSRTRFMIRVSKAF